MLSLVLAGALSGVVAFDCVPPNVLIVLDRSGSMDNELPGGERKWDVAVSAISNLVLSFDDRVRFGIGTFPTGGARCEIGQLTLPVADAQGMAVAMHVQGDGPDGEGTPIADSLMAISSADPALGDATRGNFVLLVTDGQENCDGQPTQAVTMLRSRTPEVKTFVVGFGDEVDAGELNAMADAGGTARTTDPRFFQANDPASLEAALAEIAIQVTGGDIEFATCDDPGSGGGGGAEEGGGSGGGGSGGGAGGGPVGETPGACACNAGGRAPIGGGRAWVILGVAFACIVRRHAR